jgi:hypothetical protein
LGTLDIFASPPELAWAGQFHIQALNLK